MKVRDVMTEKVETVLYTASIQELSQLLDKLQVSGVPVVDADGNLVGVVSRTDIGSGVSDPPVASESAGGDLYQEDHPLAGLEGAKVADLMTEAVVTVEPHTEVVALIQKMEEAGIHRVFVTSGEELVGVVSAMDLVRQLKKILQREASPA